jgi:ATP-dependent DNA helicase RecG
MSKDFLKYSLSNPIEYLKGCGPMRAEALRGEVGVVIWQDLLNYFPFRYVDKSQVLKIAEIQSDQVAVQLHGQLVVLEESGVGKAKRLRGVLRDSTGDIDLIWFKGQTWLKKSLKIGSSYVVYGKPTVFKGKYNIAHPEMEHEEEARVSIGSPLKPVYSATEKMNRIGLNSNGIAKLTLTLIEEIKGAITENLPPYLLSQYKLMPREEAYYQIHAPSSHEKLEAARRRFKFEELLFLQLQLVRQKLSGTKYEKGAAFRTVGEYFNGFYSGFLPFELTGAQKRVLKEIRADVARGQHMNRLIQGDVGSGKTIVAVLAALLAIDNEFQVCLMAPTEILAQQHYSTIRELLEGFNEVIAKNTERAPLQVALLTGSVSARDRKPIHEGLQNGSIQFIIGTHALIEPAVQFKNLGLVIIDEQHRFGVAQRAKLWKKAELPPHVLVMTATPIPRTLAMTLYGDLDTSMIDELPPGRKSIETNHYFDSARNKIFKFIEDQIALGRQIYIVYPLIEESEKMDYKDLMDGYKSISRRFPLPNYKIGIVHGRMKPEDKSYEMAQFSAGITQILVATTVIEVGVNVPNATVMIIESAERFGLSQLHQLRGRVGRGDERSYCILMTGNKLSRDSRLRMETMCRTQDGFEIAEVDLQLRGPGDIMGTQQSGLPDLRIADLVKDQQILVAARNTALEITDEDPDLSLPKNTLLKEHIEWTKKRKSDWSIIS